MSLLQTRHVQQKPNLLTKENLAPATENAENPRCYFDLTVDDKLFPQRIVFELYADKLPKTCDNFLTLIQGNKVDPSTGRRMHYKNSILYEIIPDWVLAGGDFVNNNGTGGVSVFNEKEFEDENFSIAHDQPGLISMLSHGPNTNSSIFFVTLQPAEWLTGLYVAFGKVIFGLDVLEEIARKYGTTSGLPTKQVRITDCGVL